jgi:hypothetical protein
MTDVKSSARWDMSVKTSASIFGSRRVEEVGGDMMISCSELMVVLSRGESRTSKSLGIVKTGSDVEVSMVL